LCKFHAAFFLVVGFFGSINLAKFAGTDRQTDADSRQIQPSHKSAPMNKGMDFAGLISGGWLGFHFNGSDIFDFVVCNSKSRFQQNAMNRWPWIKDKCAPDKSKAPYVIKLNRP
jgi:hypothetical protein